MPQSSHAGLDARLWSGSDSESPLDEPDLADNVALRQPPDLPLSDDVHCLVTRDGVQCAVHGPEPLAGDDTLLHKTVVIVQVVGAVFSSEGLGCALRCARMA